MRITEQQLRKIIREELMKEDTSKTFVKSMRIDAEGMMNRDEPFVIEGYTEDEVEIKEWDSLKKYQVAFTTTVTGDVSDNVISKVAQAIVPIIRPNGIKKSEKVIAKIQAKGEEFNMGDIKQTLQITLPEFMQVDYR